MLNKNVGKKWEIPHTHVTEILKNAVEENKLWSSIEHKVRKRDKTRNLDMVQSFKIMMESGKPSFKAKRFETNPQ